MAITVPGTQKLVSAKPNHKAGVVLYEAVDVRRAIPDAKRAAVKAVLDANGDTSKWSIDSGGFGGTWPQREGRGFRIRFNSMKTEAQVNTFLAAVETAVTT